MATQSKEIPLLGLSTSPSDYDCGDGNLSAAINVLHNDDTIRMVDFPEVVFMHDNLEVLFLHTTDTKTNYISKYIEDSTLHYGWICKDDVGNVVEFVSDGSPIFPSDKSVSFSSIGNSLIAFDESNVYYFLFSENKGYEFLGNHMPSINISFGLKEHNLVKRKWDSYDADKPGMAIGYRDGNTTTSTYATEEWCEDFGYAYIHTINGQKKSMASTRIASENQETITEFVVGAVNKYISNQHDKGRFVHPFLIRYAYRLYDGTLTMHSCPVLMVTNTGSCPLCVIDRLQTNGSENNYNWFHLEGQSYSLDYRIESDMKTLKEKWKDIVKSVDVFISAPFYPYESGGRCDSISAGDGFVNEPMISDWANQAKLHPYYKQLFDKYTVSSHTMQDESIKTSYNKRSIGYISYEKSRDASLFLYNNYDSSINAVLFAEQYGDNYHIGAPQMIFNLPTKPTETRNKEIRECSTFYLLKSYNIGDLDKTSNRIEIEIGKGVLNNIVSSEVMTDDFYSNDSIIPSMVCEYNGRLNFGNVKRNYSFAPGIEYMISYQDRNNNKDSITMFRIEEKSRSIVLAGENHKYTNIEDIYIPYLCYPNPSANAVQLNLGEDMSATFTLKEHVGLNAAVYFDNFVESSITYSDSLEPTADNCIIYKSEIQTSDVDNPFVFRATNVERIGNGEIIAMVPAAQALSTGQFGEFPMYAFTTDGIWALSVSNTGGWASKQPIARDVAINSNCILQLDQSVIFATKRGLMEISGSTVTCISEVFDGNEENLLSKYSDHFADVINGNTDITFNSKLPMWFKDYVLDNNTHMHYDYRHQRIIISNGEAEHCFVFNMKDKLWTTTSIKITSSVNSYPNALANASFSGRSALIDLSADGDNSMHNIPNEGFVLTRPIKLGETDTMKTVRTIVVRGNLDRSHADLMLYASRDMANWMLIGNTKGNRISLRHGTPYKYFRVGIITRLEEKESISGLTIEYEIKQTNKIR